MWAPSLRLAVAIKTLNVESLEGMRESKNLSRGDIEECSWLLRCYISRVENLHTVPSVETLEKMARALEGPMYRPFYDGEAPASLRKLKPPKEDEFGSKGAEADYLSKLRRLPKSQETSPSAVPSSCPRPRNRSTVL
jgi:transcriptional regulator with XRE-family HTH domain